MTIFEQIRDLLCRQFDLDPTAIQPQTSLLSLGIDSLAALELAFDVEDAFHIRLDVSTDLRGATVQDMVAVIERASAAVATPATA